MKIKDTMDSTATRNGGMFHSTRHRKIIIFIIILGDVCIFYLEIYSFFFRVQTRCRVQMSFRIQCNDDNNNNNDTYKYTEVEKIIAEKKNNK